MGAVRNRPPVRLSSAPAIPSPGSAWYDARLGPASRWLPVGPAVEKATDGRSHSRGARDNQGLGDAFAHPPCQRPLQAPTVKTLRTGTTGRVQRNTFKHGAEPKIPSIGRLRRLASSERRVALWPPSEGLRGNLTLPVVAGKPPVMLLQTFFHKKGRNKLRMRQVAAAPRTK